MNVKCCVSVCACLYVCVCVKMGQVTVMICVCGDCVLTSACFLSNYIFGLIVKNKLRYASSDTCQWFTWFQVQKKWHMYGVVIKRRKTELITT